jgi:hypothetical protein
MKRLIPFVIAASMIISGCLSSTPDKTQRSSNDAQRERASQAFDELEGGHATQAPSNQPTHASQPAPRPEPRLTPATAEPILEFSESTHLIARGYGQTSPEAIRRAKAELSNIFESRIESDVSSVTRATTDTLKGDALYKNVQSKIRIASSVELEGVEVGPVTKDGREYVADVALNRERAAQKWQNDLARISARIDVEENAARTSPGKLMKLKHLNSAMGLFLDREALISRLRVIDRPADGANPKAFEHLVASLQETKTHFRFSLNGNSQHAQTLTHKLAKKLTEAGFLVGERDSDVTLKVTVALSQVKNNDPNFKFMRATADVAIIDPSTGKMVGNINENQREGHLTYEEAGVKALSKLSDKLSRKIVDYFN